MDLEVHRSECGAEITVKANDYEHKKVVPFWKLVLKSKYQEEFKLKSEILMPREVYATMTVSQFVYTQRLERPSEVKVLKKTMVWDYVRRMTNPSACSICTTSKYNQRVPTSGQYINTGTVHQEKGRG